MSSGRLSIGIAVGLLMAFMASLVNAAEWSLEPSLRVKGEYNSNLTITDRQHEAVWGHWVSPSAKLQGSTENFDISSRLAADFVQYYGEGDKTLTNIYLPLSMQYRTERNKYGFDGGYVRDNTLLNELTLTGVVLAFTQRNEYKAAPSWSHLLTEKLSWDNTYQFSHVTYESGQQLGLANYQTHVASSGLSYKLTERDEIQGSVQYLHFTIPDFQQRSSYVGFQLAAQHLFSDTLKATVAGGPRFVTSSLKAGGLDLTDNETVWVASGTLTKTFERSTVALDVGREIYPSGFGLLIRSDRIAGTISHELTDMATLAFTASYYVVGSVTGAASRVAFADTNFMSFMPRATWKLSDWWSVECAYTYAQRTVDAQSVRAESNAAYISLIYNAPKMAISR